MAEKSPQELIQINFTPPPRKWMNPAVDFEARRGTWSYPAAVKNLKYLGQPNPRDWSPADADWKLPENWQQIIHEGFKDLLKKYRSLPTILSRNKRTYRWRSLTRTKRSSCVSTWIHSSRLAARLSTGTSNELVVRCPIRLS